MSDSDRCEVDHRTNNFDSGGHSDHFNEINFTTLFYITYTVVIFFTAVMTTSHTTCMIKYPIDVATLTLTVLGHNN